MSNRAVPAPVADLIDAALEASIVGSFTRVGYGVRRVVDGWDESGPALAGRVALVTGATSGLGLATARGFAAEGAHVVLLGRDEGRLATARAEIRAELPDARLDTVVADLSRLDDMRSAAVELQRRFDRLDVVVHNAGTLVHDLEVTDDGLEITVQTHVAAPFLLTQQLLPLLVESTDPRVIQVVSGGLYTTRLSVETMATLPATDPGQFDGVRTYALAKRAALTLTHEWARRTAGSDLARIRFHAMHPGWADTAGVRDSLPGFHRVLGPLLRTPDQAVDTTRWLASAPEARRSNGQFWLDRRRRRDAYLPWTADPDGEGARLWTWVSAATQVDDPFGLQTASGSVGGHAIGGDD